MLPANDPSLHSWVDIAPESDFSLQNLPFGVFCHPEGTPHGATAIGEYVVDLAMLQELRYFDALQLPPGIFDRPFLNDFIALGRPAWRAVRQRLSDLFNAEKGGELRNHHEAQKQVMYPRAEAELLMPVYVRDYTDFYSSEEHATNVGTMFRGKENALMPNWKHLPVGYHGRTSSLIVSGTPVHRPKGQTRPQDDQPPVYGPCKLLDFELEMGFVIGQATELGESVSTNAADAHIFGLVLFNDWSARDIQKWEYVPLGPFLGKSFASSVSPWIVTLDALEPFRVPGKKQDPPVLPYLQCEGDRNYDIELEVLIQAPGSKAATVSRSNHKYLYWNMAQQLAHHTVNGCNLNVGDLMASGTISGPTPDSYGSMLELSWRGSMPLSLPDGSERKFLLDGDTVVMRGYAQREGVRVGFGEVRTQVFPAKE